MKEGKRKDNLSTFSGSFILQIVAETAALPQASVEPASYAGLNLFSQLFGAVSETSGAVQPSVL